MAFPFDVLDLFLPEIAHWMAGRSTSERRRLRRAGTGLLLTGCGLGLLTWWAPELAVWAFRDAGWAVFVALLFGACGVGLLCWYKLEQFIASWQHGRSPPSNS